MENEKEYVLSSLRAIQESLRKARELREVGDFEAIDFEAYAARQLQILVAKLEA